jgi:hypothetical protein
LIQSILIHEGSTCRRLAGAAPPSLRHSGRTGPKSSTGDGGYGAPSRVADQNGDEVLALPEGFDYVTLSKIGDIMSDGNAGAGRS